MYDTQVLPRCWSQLLFNYSHKLLKYVLNSDLTIARRVPCLSCSAPPPRFCYGPEIVRILKRALSQTFPGHSKSDHQIFFPGSRVSGENRRLNFSSTFRLIILFIILIATLIDLLLQNSFCTLSCFFWRRQQDFRGGRAVFVQLTTVFRNLAVLQNIKTWFAHTIPEQRRLNTKSRCRHQSADCS